MIYTIHKFKAIIKVVPKAACTSTKYYLHQLLAEDDLKLKEIINGKHPHDMTIFKYLKNQGDVFLQESILKNLIFDENYSCYIVYRNPIDRFYSGCVQKYLSHLPNCNKSLIEPLCPSPRLRNFYLWFISNVSCNLEHVDWKSLIDYHCNLQHNFEIDPHFLPISDIVPVFFLENSKLISTNGLYSNLNKIFSKCFTDKYFNVTNKEGDISNNYNSKILNTSIIDPRIKTNCSYYIKSVEKKFINDIFLYKDKLKHMNYI